MFYPGLDKAGSAAGTFQKQSVSAARWRAHEAGIRELYASVNVHPAEPKKLRCDMLALYLLQIDHQGSFCSLTMFISKKLILAFET